MKISDNTAISMPMRNLIAILVVVAAGVWAYSEITTRLTFLETSKQLMEQDLLEASTQKPIDRDYANWTTHPNNPMAAIEPAE